MPVGLRGGLSAEGNRLAGLQQRQVLAGPCLGSQGEGAVALFTVQSDPGDSGADYLFHGLIGLVPASFVRDS